MSIWRRGATSDEHDAERQEPWKAGSRGNAPEQPPSGSRQPRPSAQAGGQDVPHWDPSRYEVWDAELPPPPPVGRRIATETRARMPGWVRRAAWIAISVLAGLGALAGVVVAWMHVTGDPLADARAYYEAAARLNVGQPLYPSGVDPNGNQIYLYPPMLAVLLRPLAVFGYPLFAFLWELAIVGSFVVLLRHLGVRRRETWVAVGLLGIPIGWALSIAQAHVPMTLLLALGQPWSIAIAANLKLTPALIAIWWLGRRDFQAFFAFLVWVILLALAQLALEVDGTLAFFGSVGFDQVGEVRNLSPYVQSPWLWLGLVLVGALVTLALARTRWGWAAAVTLATVSPPRLLVYMLMGLLAAIREPRSADAERESPFADPARVYRQATR